MGIMNNISVPNPSNTTAELYDICAALRAIITFLSDIEGSSETQASIRSSAIARTPKDISSDHTVGELEDDFNISAIDGAVNLYLPVAYTPVEGRTIVVKKTDSTSNIVTIVGTIDGDANFILYAEDETVILRYSNGGWYVS